MGVKNVSEQSGHRMSLFSQTDSGHSLWVIFNIISHLSTVYIKYDTSGERAGEYCDTIITYVIKNYSAWKLMLWPVETGSTSGKYQHFTF